MESLLALASFEMLEVLEELPALPGSLALFVALEIGCSF